MTTLFRDRVGQFYSWFLEWNQYEQTMALYSLLSKVHATQARFFLVVLQHILQAGQDQEDLAGMEADANDPTFLSAIHSEQDSVALSNILSNILLLRPGNDQAREEYLKLLPKVLFGSAEDSDYLYQCRLLLSLALVHPAFCQDREKLAFWLSRLDDKSRSIAEKNRVLGGIPHHRSATLPIQTHHHSSGALHSSTLQSSSTLHSSSPPRRIYQLRTESCDDIINVGPHRNGANRIYINLHQPNPIGSMNEFDTLGEIDTHPLFDDEEDFVKGFTYSNHQVQEAHCSTPNGYDDYMKKVKNKSLSLPSNRASSACSLPATFDKNPARIFWKPGMKDVPAWLKSLRLHKYKDLFVDMTYDSFLNITEEFLHENNITQGALKKILISIKKLRQRADRLAEIEQDTEKQGELLSCIHRLHQIVVTPIKPYISPEDQPATATTGSATSLTSETETIKPSRPRTTTPGGEEGTLSPEGSPQHGSSIQQREAGGSSEDSPCSTPPTSPCLRRSSSISSVDDLLAKDFCESDLPSLITRAIGKVYSQLMMHTETNEENLDAFVKVLDIVMCHEAFIVSHRKMFFDWKQQCQQTLSVLSPKKSPRNKGWPNAFTIAGNPPHPKVPFPDKKPSRRSNMRNTMGHKVPTSIMGSPRSSSTLPKANIRQFQQPFPPPYYPPPRSRSNTGSSIKQLPIPVPSVIKTHRYVNMTIPKPTEVSEMQMDELCKRVTEHALEGDFN